MKAWIALGAVTLHAAVATAQPVAPTEALGVAAMVATAAAECGLRPKAWADDVVAAAINDAVRHTPADAIGGGSAPKAVPGMVSRVATLGRYLAHAELRRDREATCRRVAGPGALDQFDRLARARAAKKP